MSRRTTNAVTRMALAGVLAVFGRFATADDAFDRLAVDRLAEVRASVDRFKMERREPRRPRALRDFRANLHVHSSFSHDSRGTIDEIVTAAKAAGTSVLMFTEHPADHYDFFRDGHQGTRDGVLLVPGAETRGLLVFPRHSLRGAVAEEAQQLSNLVRGRGGLSFLSHLEERLDWELGGLTGVEIYNTHADFKDEKRLASSLRNPLWLLNAASLFRQYPQEAFSALQDYPADYLRRWDQLCARSPHTGISANDAHQNIGLAVRLSEGNKVRVEDALGAKLLELDASLVAAILPVPPDAKVGAILYRTQLDPYECSLRHVGTHLLLPERTVDAVREALERGRAFVAFDWLADATGFDFAAETAGRRHEMGSRLARANDLKLTGAAPLDATWKLVRDGAAIHEAEGREFTYAVTDTGNYRVELWLKVAGEPRAWILSNPFYIEK